MANDPAYNNKTVIAVDTIVIVRKTPSFSGEKITSVKAGNVIGRSSGIVLSMPDGKWIQVNLTNPVNNNKYGYVAEIYKGKQNVKLQEPESSPEAEKNAQKLLNEVVRNDKETFATLLNCYNKIRALKNKNITIPESLLLQLSSVYISLANRQERLKNIKGTEISTATPNDTNSADSLAQMVASSHIRGIGWIPLIIIVVAIIVGAASAVAVYYATKPDYEDSKRDLKVSRTLQKALNSLTPEEQSIVKNELEKQVDDSYNAGKTHQRFSDLFGTGAIKTAVIGFAAFLIGREIFKRKKSKNG